LIKQATLLAAFIIVACVSFARPANDTNQVRAKQYRDSVMQKIPALDDMLLEILDAAGLNYNFELKKADVLNIETSISHKKRLILYNPSFIASLNSITKDKWAVMTLLAHEIGHHLNGHTNRRGGSSPKLELKADEFAGFVLHKLGATLHQSQNVMHYIAKTKDSRTHPARESRLLAIEKGWNKASDLQAAY
jgi:hypothetical protein